MSKFDSVQKISHFKVRDFGRISYKKLTKLAKIGILRDILIQMYQQLKIFIKISLNLQQMTMP